MFQGIAIEPQPIKDSAIRIGKTVQSDGTRFNRKSSQQGYHEHLC